jgi:hypothetical protein
VSTVHRARQHLKEATGAAAVAHEEKLRRRREHSAKLKAEREAREAQMVADAVHANEATAAGP